MAFGSRAEGAKHACWWAEFDHEQSLFAGTAERTFVRARQWSLGPSAANWSIYDTTGQHILWSKSTLVPVDTEASVAIERDNHGHEEIMNALREERDAVAVE